MSDNLRTILVCALLVAGITPTALGQSQASQRIDYHADVVPIFRTHCAQCHSEQNIEGNLNLLSPQSIVDGGFSGLPIVGPSVEASELIQRIKSEDSDFRMPKSKAALSPAEITTLANWVEQGGLFEPPKKPPAPPTMTDRLAQVWTAIEAASTRKPFQYAAVCFVPLICYWVLLIFNRLRKRSKPLEQDSHARTASGRFGFLLISISFLAISVIAFQQGLLAERAQESNAGKSELEVAIRSHEQDFSRRPNVPYPMHPPRLGGTYYRGNDERNAHLFNGGFYRTATLSLQLVDSDGNPIERGKSAELEDAAIRLVIQRSQNATQGMFDRRTMATTFVSKSFRGTESANDRQLLRAVNEGGEWTVDYPLKDFHSELESSSDAGTAAGEIQKRGELFVYYGPLEHNRIHYAIQFDVRVAGGEITNDSILWMGSTYNLNGRVMIPNDKDILLDRWFDFRPIPEIPDFPEIPEIPEISEISEISETEPADSK